MIPGDLAASISNLVSEFGSTDNVQLATALNVTLGLVGVGVWWATTGIPSFVGAVWAILHFLAIFRWVMGL